MLAHIIGESYFCKDTGLMGHQQEHSLIVLELVIIVFRELWDFDSNCWRSAQKAQMISNCRAGESRLVFHRIL